LLLVAVAAVHGAPGFYPGFYPSLLPNLYTNLLLKKAALGFYSPYRSPLSLLAASHSSLFPPTLTIHKKHHVPLLKPFPVVVDKPLPFVVKKKVPVFYDAPYPVKVDEPVNYFVDKPVHVPVDAPYHVAINKDVPVPYFKDYPVSVGAPLSLKEPLDVTLGAESLPSFPEDVHLAKKK